MAQAETDKATEAPAVEIAQQAAPTFELAWTDKEQLAVGFVTYGQEFEQVAQSCIFSQWLAQYPALGLLEDFTLNHKGDEVYLIIPRNPDDRIDIYAISCELTDEGKRVDTMGELLLSLPNTKQHPLLLVHCNQSEIIPNVLIRLTKADSSTVEYTPQCSLHESGFAEVPAEGTVKQLLIKPQPEAEE